MENLLLDFEMEFFSLFYTQKDRFNEYIELLAKLPTTHETKSLYARVKQESQAIITARAQHKNNAQMH